MGDDNKSSTEESRIVDKDKKRKCQGELVEIPWPKHVRWCSSEDESTLRNPDLASCSSAISSEFNSHHSSETGGGSRPESSSISEGLNNYHQDHRQNTESSSSGYHQSGGSNIEQSGNDGDDDRNVHLEQPGNDGDDDLYSSGVGPWTHLILSENREEEGTTKKLTIDKEFEEYFSTLLL